MPMPMPTQKLSLNVGAALPFISVTQEKCLSLSQASSLVAFQSTSAEVAGGSDIGAA